MMYSLSRKGLPKKGASYSGLSPTQGSRRENLEGLLQAFNFGFALGHALRVRHHLRLALRLELVEVRKHRVELLARGGEVLLVVEEGRLLGLHVGLLILDFLRV